MTIFLVTGGTGGHIFPALAVEKELRREGIEKIKLMAATTPLASWILKGYKDNIILLPGQGFMGKGIGPKIKFLAYFMLGLLRSFILIKKEKSHLACGFGGYGSLAFLLACYFRRIPFMMQEQNLIPGRTTRFLSRLAKETLISFPESKLYLPKAKTFFSGNPCRQEFIEAHQSLAKSGYEPEKRKLLLIVGGSQGSHFLNTKLPPPLLRLLSDFPDLRIVHLCGQREKEEVREAYTGSTSRVEVIDFSFNILNWLKEAQLVISRSGATILTEISLAGVPVILIPFAAAADNHQYYNALWFSQKGAAVMVEEKGFTVASFYLLLKDFISSPARLKDMSASLIKLAQPNAAKVVVDRILRNRKERHWLSK